MAIIRKTLAEVQNTPISQADLDRINAIKDEDIDFSDIPPLTQEDWDKAMTTAQFKKYRESLKNPA